MALNRATLKGLIVTEMQSQGFTTSGAYAFGDKLAEAIANAIVTHITTDALVTTTSGAPNGEHTGNIS